MAGGALALGGLYALYKVHQSPIAAHKQVNTKKEFSAQAGNRLVVMTGEHLVAHLNLNPIIQSCRDRMGFDSALFKKDCQPVITQAAAWVQLLPASESHHHAQPGGLLTHMMETAHYALRFRQGHLLPVGAPPEEIPEKKHRWTYAVFLAALLHDIGKPIADGNVMLFKQEKNLGRWHPLAGSMADQEATHYTLSFEIPTKNYELHQKLPIILLQRFVPAHVLSWLAQDPVLMHELTDYLSGHESYQGVLKNIITRGDSESVKLNLMSGPRTRFAAARSVPLIERLMQALRMMLEEGRLKLNQAGAHGWVFEDRLWFTSKRIADEVRAFIIERESGEGIPGKDKNDRLFDTWQEYGALIPTADNRAVWHTRIELEDGWSQNMTVICFALEKLYKTPDEYPNAMRGRIVTLDQAVAPAVLVNADFSDNSEIEPEIRPVENDLQQEMESEETPATVQDFTREKENRDSSPSSDMSNAAIPIQPSEPALPIPIKKSSPALPALNFSRVPQDIKAKIQEQSSQEKLMAKNNSEFLDNTDSATSDKRKKPPEASTLKPVAPAGQTKFIPSNNKTRKEPTEAALKFMRWIQEGLSQGELPYNRADAMIHFVDDGMMLVSPVIFRRFAELFGELGDGKPSEKSGGAVGTGIQRQVTNAGWHKVTGAEKKNIQKFIVAGHDGSGKKIISGVVILDPARFVNPLPETNPSIVAFEKTLESAD